MVSHARKVLANQQAIAEEAEARRFGGVAEAVDPALAETDAPLDPAFAAPAAVLVKTKRQVTLPVVSWPAGATIVCRIAEAFHESDVDDKRYPGKALVARIEAMNGEARTLIGGTVLRAALDKEYPGSSYVGAWFRMTKLARPDKRYSDYAITEIEAPVVPGQGDLDLNAGDRDSRLRPSASDDRAPDVA